MYDAVLTAGIGACHAQAALNGTTNGALTGEQHNWGVRHSQFRGASGNLSFGDRNFFLGGARDLGTSCWGAINFVSEELGWFEIPDMLLPDLVGPRWSRLLPYVYADGTDTPPALLRDLPEQNYLNSSLRTLGFTLMGVAGFCSISACIWVVLCRKHKVLTAAQPFFLYIVCFGTLVQSSTIAAISFDGRCNKPSSDRQGNAVIAHVYTHSV